MPRIRKYIETARFYRVGLFVVGLFLVVQAGYSEPVDSGPADSEKPLVVGVFPRKGFTVAMQTFAPLADYLAEKLNRPVKLESAPDFAAFWKGVEKRRYDLVHFNQYYYARAHNSHSYDVIAKNEEHGRSTMAGVIVVRRESDINSLEDLRGRKILFGGGRMAMQSYIVTSYLLRQAGLQPGDYREEFARSPANALLAAYFGMVPAAGSADANIHLSVVTNTVDISEFRILAIGEQLSHLPWAVKKEMPEPLRKHITEIFLGMAETRRGRAVLKQADLTGLLPARDDEYDAHRKIINAVLGEKY